MSGTISVCMIVKNESGRIRDCIKNIEPLADEIIVCDTGSSDDTLETAKAASEKVKCFSYQWNNSFADARNCSISHAACDWVLWIDADERIDIMEQKKIRICIESYPDAPVAFQFLNNNVGANKIGDIIFDMPFPQIKFFRNNCGIKFENRLHETVLKSCQRLNIPIVAMGINVLHYGYLDNAKLIDKAERNSKLTIMESQKLPDTTEFQSFRIGKYHCHYLPNVLFIFDFLSLIGYCDPFEGDYPSTNESRIDQMLARAAKIIKEYQDRTSVENGVEDAAKDHFQEQIDRMNKVFERQNK